MTTLALNYSRNLLDAISNFFSSIATAAMVSRQMEANLKLAHMLKHEYPDESYEGIVAILNQKTVGEYYK